MKDEKYVEERDKLIPIAKKYADKMSGGATLHKMDTSQDWNRYFHVKMDELAIEKGLIKKGRK